MRRVLRRRDQGKCHVCERDFDISNICRRHTWLHHNGTYEALAQKTARKGGHDMNQTIYDYIGLGAVIVAIVLLVGLLNVANARARAKMTPEERAEHDEEVSRLEQEWWSP
jgi:hypothetical protein